METTVLDQQLNIKKIIIIKYKHEMLSSSSKNEAHEQVLVKKDLLGILSEENINSENNPWRIITFSIVLNIYDQTYKDMHTKVFYRVWMDTA